MIWTRDANVTGWIKKWCFLIYIKHPNQHVLQGNGYIIYSCCQVFHNCIWIWLSDDVLILSLCTLHNFFEHKHDKGQAVWWNIPKREDASRDFTVSVWNVCLQHITCAFINSSGALQCVFDLIKVGFLAVGVMSVPISFITLMVIQMCDSS